MKDLLKKWINGSITWSAEKKLRQAAEQDHFLAEAMEGYDAFPITNHAAKIEQLKGRFRQPKKEEKGMIFSLSRVAAAAAIIGVIGMLFWVQRTIEQKPVLSQRIEQIEALPLEENGEKKAVLEEVVATKKTIEKQENINKNQLPKPAIQPIKKQPKVANKIPVEEKVASNLATNKNPSIAANKEVVETEEVTTAARTVEIPVLAPTPESLPTAVGESMILAEAIEREPKPTLPPVADLAYSTQVAPIDAEKQTYARKRRSKTKEIKEVDKINYYVGQVRNEDGQPMQEAKIIGLNTSFNTLSTRNGEFVLAVDSPLTKLTVSKEGFHTRKIAINQYSDFLNIAIVKKSTIPVEDAELKAKTLEPKPKAGFKDFFKYLENNRIYPIEAKEKGMERAVEIHFYINENGTPSNLKIANPDLYGFDKEAIRLLENGPKWMPANSHARYYISFKLE